MTISVLSSEQRILQEVRKMLTAGNSGQARRCLENALQMVSKAEQRNDIGTDTDKASMDETQDYWSRSRQQLAAQAQQHEALHNSKTYPAKMRCKSSQVVPMLPVKNEEDIVHTSTIVLVENSQERESTQTEVPKSVHIHTKRHSALNGHADTIHSQPERTVVPSSTKSVTIANGPPALLQPAVPMTPSTSESALKDEMMKIQIQHHSTSPSKDTRQSPLLERRALLQKPLTSSTPKSPYTAKATSFSPQSPAASSSAGILNESATLTLRNAEKRNAKKRALRALAVAGSQKYGGLQKYDGSIQRPNSSTLQKGHDVSQKSFSGLRKSMFPAKGTSALNLPSASPQRGHVGVKTQAFLKGRNERRHRETLKIGVVLNPDNSFFRFWDLYTVALLIYTAFFTPFQIAFLSEERSESGSIEISKVLLMILDQIVNASFILDMVFNFMLGYHGKSGTYVINQKLIARNYLQSWFLIDLASILPVDLVMMIVENDSFKNLKMFRMIRLFRMLKLLRILRSARIFARWEVRMAINYNFMNLYKALLNLVLLAHWFACLLGAMDSFQRGDSCSSLDQHQDLETSGCTWYDAQKFIGRTDRTVGTRYLTCLYWSVGELMSLTYGDIIPTNNFERIIFSILHLMAGLAHALLTGGIVGIMAAIGAKNARFYARMDRLNEFITGKHLQADDPELAEGLRRYFLFRERQCGEQTGGWLDLVSDVSPWFRGQIATIVHGHWISKVSYFHGIDPKTGLEWDVDEHFRIQLACHVKSHIYAPGEVIVHFADPCKDMLVISKGLVGCRGQILKDGDSFGEETIIMHDLDRRRGYCATAITHVVLMHVSGKDICDIMDEPGNEMVKFRIRQQCFWYQCRRVLRRIVRTIRYAARLEFTLTDARTIFKLEFHDTVLDDIPSLWEAWMVLRDENGDPLIHAVKVMQRLARTLRFKRSINEVVQQGTKRRRHQALIQSARGWLAEVKLHAPDECAEIFVKHRMSLELLLSTPLLPSFFVLMGICVADAVLLAEHFKKAAAAQKLGPAHKLSGSTTVE